MDNRGQLASQSQFDVRAPPRRRAKGEEMDEQPVFLRKAYNMISSCPSEIGGWSDEGDAIVIKDMKSFSEKVIPTAYRHNNFASFVRQLNFYGFRKVRSDSLDKAEWWIFRHPHFLRGQPNLISEIKRSVHFAADSSGGKEVTDLKDQVMLLTDKLAMLTQQFDRLSVVVSQINSTDMQQVEQQQLQMSQPTSKKRKLQPPSTGNTSPFPSIKLEPGSGVPPSLEAPALTRQISLSAFDFDYFMKLENSSFGGFGTPSGALQMVRTPSQLQLQAELGVNDDDDDTMSVSFLTDTEFAKQSPSNEAMIESEVPAQMSTYSESLLAQGAATTVQDLACIIGSLSPDLKERFVDRLAEVMGTQIANRLAEVTVPPITTATVSANTPRSYSNLVSSAPPPLPLTQSSLSFTGLQRQSSTSSLLVNGEYVLPSGAKAPEIALPLASAAISAYLISALRNLSTSLNQSNPVPEKSYKAGSFTITA